MSSRSVLLWLFVLAGAAGLLVGPAPAFAQKKLHEDRKLGFRVRIEDDWTQSPPKLTPDSAFMVGEWYQDAAKYDSWQLKPEFKVLWFVTPKDAPAEAAGGDKPEFDPNDPAAFLRAMREQLLYHSVDEALDAWFQMNEHLFGAHVPMTDRWRACEQDKTDKKQAFQCLEVNAPSKKKKDDKGKDAPHGYAYVARMTIERPKETIEVGFVGFCSVDYVKRFQKEFPAIVRSFEELKDATDSRNEAAKTELSQDRETRYQQILKSKLVKGWKAERTANYILVHHEEVEPKLVRQIGQQIEGIRSQVYEVMFPPDRPITAFSIVRVCKDREQYMGYGAPGSSAGYWDAHAEELVFYEDQSNKKDSLRVLYHEAFHQYIFYSVGDFSPHSWFNEGHGDYFAGHDYSAGKFVREPFQWRVSPAKDFKRHAKRPRLKDWLAWTQRQYYGDNDAKIDGGMNYAAGWSFVWFLRTTRKPEYQGILDRYFNALKGCITRQRALDEAFRKELEEWEKKSADDPQLPRPERKEDPYASDPLPHAINEAFAGVDLDQLEKDWLAADY